MHVEFLRQIDNTPLSIEDFRIHVGQKKVKPREFPHLALVGYDGKLNSIDWLCSGSLISEYFVLTAAHCLNYSKIGEAKYIRVGDLPLLPNDDDTSRQEFNIIRTFVYPNYTPPSHYNDIAVLKIDKQAKLDPNVQPACLPLASDLSAEKYIATGWGKTGVTVNASKELVKVELVHFPHKKCNISYRNNISRRLPYGILDIIQICASSATEGADTCQGDSGGPLQINNNDESFCTYTIVGVTSFGKACGAANIPGVYTRVSYYVEWIESVVWSDTDMDKVEDNNID